MYMCALDHLVVEIHLNFSAAAVYRSPILKETCDRLALKGGMSHTGLCVLLSFPRAISKLAGVSNSFPTTRQHAGGRANPNICRRREMNVKNSKFSFSPIALLRDLLNFY